MFFDTHAHLDDSAFDEDRDEVIERFRKAGVDRVLNPGCDEKSTRMAAELSEKYSFICFAAGFHPEELAGVTGLDWRQILIALQAFTETRLVDVVWEPFALSPVLPALKCSMNDSPLIRYLRESLI